MADRPRKRQSNASCSDGNTSNDYDAVDIRDPTAPASARGRRRSACNSSSSTGSSSAVSKTESWMTKVTSAMSHRIFSGKRLGASRSTQVMPLAAAAAAAPISASGSTPISAAASVGGVHAGEHHEQETNVQRQQQKLRQVSSENSLARAPTESAMASQVLTPVEKVDFCPSAVCDIAVDDFDDDDDGDYRSRSGQASARGQQQPESKASPVLQSIQVRAASSRRGNSVIEKVVPRDHESGDEDSDSDVIDRRQGRHSSSTCASWFSSSRHNDEDGDVRDTAPILKDFFSRSASTGQGLRAQQRESRREAVYKTSFQRQELLRQRVEVESLALETQQQKKRVEQLQRATQQRRMHLRREAATARKHLVSRLEGDKHRFVRERERWEGEFEDEMQALSRAFRKANAKTMRSDLGGANGASSRPTTVAGLAVPEALSQIRREASNYEKRLKTAVPHQDRQFGRSWDIGARRQRASASGSVDVLQVDKYDQVWEDVAADEDDDYTAILCSDDGDSDEEAEVAVKLGFLPPDDTESSAGEVHTFTIEELLDERQELLWRIAELEKLVEQSRRVQHPTAEPKQPDR